jgi:hypothetical protein
MPAIATQMFFIFYNLSPQYVSDATVKALALSYKPEGRWFDTQ